MRQVLRCDSWHLKEAEVLVYDGTAVLLHIRMYDLSQESELPLIYLFFFNCIIFPYCTREETLKERGSYTATHFILFTKNLFLSLYTAILIFSFRKKHKHHHKHHQHHNHRHQHHSNETVKSAIEPRLYHNVTNQSANKKDGLMFAAQSQIAADYSLFLLFFSCTFYLIFKC